MWHSAQYSLLLALADHLGWSPKWSKYGSSKWNKRPDGDGQCAAVEASSLAEYVCDIYIYLVAWEKTQK